MPSNIRKRTNLNNYLINTPTQHLLVRVKSIYVTGSHGLRHHLHGQREGPGLRRTPARLDTRAARPDSCALLAGLAALLERNLQLGYREVPT